MPTNATVTTFDYNSLDRDTASFVQQQTGEIRALMRRATQDIFEIGQKLIEVKKRLGHGNYGDWLQAEFAWTERTAQRFTNVVETFGHESDIMSELNFAPTALYTLAAPTISERAREEALDRAKAGEFISAKTAEQIKQKYPAKPHKYHKSSKNASKKAPVEKSVEIIDGELEIPLSQQPNETVEPPSPAPKIETVSEKVQLQPEEVKALPHQPPQQWWTLHGFEQQHLLFNGHPKEQAFLCSSPNEVGVWLGSPPTPNECLCPPQDRAKTVLSYTTIYKGINLNAIRKLIEGLIEETSSKEDRTAMLAYLPDPPLLLLFDDFGFDCYIAEPDIEQCQKILSVWEQLGGTVEKLENPLEPKENA